MEKFDNFFANFFSVLERIVLIFAVSAFMLFCFLIAQKIVNYFSPPEKIEENGYTYQLENYQPENYQPEQTIERYGETYVLVEE